MAKKNAAYNKTASFQEVIQCSFMGKEADKVVGYIATPEALIDMTEILTSTGYEVSVRFDPVRENYSVCLKGVSEDCPNAGLWLYGNADTLLDAYCSAYFKYFEIFEQKKWVARSTPNAGGIS